MLIAAFAFAYGAWEILGLAWCAVVGGWIALAIAWRAHRDATERPRC
jgi:hypothetical protein